MKKNTISIIILLLFGLEINAQTEKCFQGFSGGMYLHSGFMKSETFSATFSNTTTQHQIKNFTFGLGGKLGLHFKNHFIVGGEGYSSNITYGDNNNHYSLLWGGALIDYYFKTEKLLFSIGLTFGGSSIDHYIYNSNSYNDYISDDIVYHSFQSFIISPHVCWEWFLTNKIALSIKADHLFYFSEYKNKDLSKGTRLYLGIIFHQH